MQPATRDGHLPVLDAVRGLAVALVFCFHYGGGAHSPHLLLRAIGFLCAAGWTGVPLFFVLSGFLITGILWDARSVPHWWRNFYIRRSLRIFPLYFFALLINVGFAFALHRAPVLLHNIWIYLFYLQDIPPFQNASSIAAPPLPLFHFWSLAVEEQFYLFWPFLLLATKSPAAARRLCAAGFLSSLAFRLAALHLGGSATWGVFLFSHAGELCAGGWLAMRLRERRSLKLSNCIGVLLGAVAAMVALVGATGTINTDQRWIYVAGLALLAVIFTSLIAVVLAASWGQALAFRPLQWLGRISYGVYVYHGMLIVLVGVWAEELLPGRGDATLSVARFAIAAAATLTIASLSYYGMEKPFLRLKSRFGGLKPAAVTVATDESR